MREEVLGFRNGDDDGRVVEEKIGTRVEDETESVLVRVSHSSEVAIR